MVVGKITLGLGQVVSRQPSAMETEFPGPQWDSPFIKLFFMDFGWGAVPHALCAPDGSSDRTAAAAVAPICQINYPSKFLLSESLPSVPLQHT